jgi:hypothetical protein
VRPWRHGGALVDLPGAIGGLADPAGLDLFERNVALLAGLRSEDLIPRSSFFALEHARKSRARGDFPRLVIAHEDVLIFRNPPPLGRRGVKVLDGAGHVECSGLPSAGQAKAVSPLGAPGGLDNWLSPEASCGCDEPTTRTGELGTDNAGPKACDVNHLLDETKVRDFECVAHKSGRPSGERHRLAVPQGNPHE